MDVNRKPPKIFKKMVNSASKYFIFYPQEKRFLSTILHHHNAGDTTYSVGENQWPQENHLLFYFARLQKNSHLPPPITINTLILITKCINLHFSEITCCDFLLSSHIKSRVGNKYNMTCFFSAKERLLVF